MESVHESENSSYYLNFSYSYMYEDYDYDYPYEKPSRISTAGQVTLITIYSLTTFVAIIGNMTVILVLTCSGRSRTDLNTFLINLAVSDVTMAIFGIPFSFVQAMLGHWVFSRGLCKMVAFMQQVSVTASIYTLVAIGVDRFFAVYYPIKKRTSKPYAKITIFVIWLLSVSLCIVQLVYVRTKEYQISMTQRLIICDEWWPQKTGIAYELFIMTVTFVIPLCLLAITYFLVARRLWGRNLPGNAHQSRDLSHTQSKRKVVKMLALIVCLFAICWLPLITVNVLGRWVDIQRDVRIITYFCCHWLAMANSFINPIVYGFLNDSFRTDLRRFFANCAFCNSRVHMPLTFNLSSRIQSATSPRRSKSSCSSRTSILNGASGKDRQSAKSEALREVATVIDLGDKQKNLIFGKPRPDVFYN